VVDFKKGKILNWKGVVPVVQGKLEWAFLNRTEKGWEQISTRNDPLVQFAAYGTALTEEQLNKMAKKVTVEEFQAEEQQKSGGMK
jgi:hypothetical protein